MKKIILSITIASVALVLSGCGYGQKTATTPAVSNQPAVQPAAPAAATPAPTNNVVNQPVAAPAPAVSNKTVNVSIQNFAFNPTPVRVKAGDTVVWVNDDPAPHQIKAPSFNSQTLNTGDSFSFKFTTAGTYDYGCAIHPSMAGQVIVE